MLNLLRCSENGRVTKTLQFPKSQLYTKTYVFAEKHEFLVQNLFRRVENEHIAKTPQNQKITPLKNMCAPGPTRTPITSPMADMDSVFLVQGRPGLCSVANLQCVFVLQGRPRPRADLDSVFVIQGRPGLHFCVPRPTWISFSWSKADLESVCRPGHCFRAPGPTRTPFSFSRPHLESVFVVQGRPGHHFRELDSVFVLQGRLANFVALLRVNTLIFLLRLSGVSLSTRCVEMAVPEYLPNQNAASVHEHAAPFTNRSRTTCSRTPFTNMTNSVHHGVHEHSVQERSRTVQMRSFTNRPFTNNRTPFRAALVVDANC